MYDLDGKKAQLAELRWRTAELEAELARANAGSVLSTPSTGPDLCYRTALNLVCDYACCWRVEPESTFTREWSTLPADSQAQTIREPQSLVVFGGIAHPDDIPRIAESVQSALAGETVGPFEVRVIAAAGRIRWMRNYLHALQHEGDGRITHLLSITQDITAQKRAEDAYHVLVDSSQLGQVILQDNGIVFANQASAEISGSTREALLSLSGEQVREAIHPDDRAWVWQNVTEWLAGKTPPSSSEFRIIRRDGAIRWVQITASRIDYLGSPALQISYLDVTDRKQTEEALKEAKADLDHAQRIARFGNWRWNARTNEAVWSDGMYRLYGLDPRQDPPGTEDWLGHIHPADRETLLQAIHDALAGTHPYDLIYRIVRADDGEERYLHTVGDVLRDQDGTPLTLFGTALDLTEHIRAETALRDSELKFRSIVEQAPDGIALTDEHGIIVDWNRANERLTGFSRDEVLGKPVWEVQFAMLPEEQRTAEQLERFKTVSQDVCTTGTAPWLGRIVEQELMRPDGQRWTVQIQAAAVRVGDRFMLMVNNRDVTEQRRAQRELENRRLEIGQIFRTLPDALVYTDVQQRIVHVNPAFTRIYGYEAEEVLGREVSLLHPRQEQFRTQDSPWHDVWAGEISDVHEFQYVRKDGTVFSGETVGTPVRDANGQITGFVDLVRDVSDRNRLERQLAQAQKMEAIGQLAGGVAHDFNNILTAIMGFSDFLLHDLARDDPRYEDLEAIRRSGERAVGLTRQLLAFSRRQMLQPRVLDLNDVIDNMGKMLRRLISEDIDMTFILAPHLGSVKVDVGQMEQVLLNLVVNAREAMPFGGSITIRTEEVDVEKPLPCFCGRMVAGRYVLLEITDSGAGMDEETLAHLFEPFFTTKDKGTGLGLATVFGIVTQSNGHITVTSTPGAGTTFRIYLPRIDETDELTQLDRSEQAAHVAGTETILLVEDADSVRHLACRILRSRGYTVLEAGTGEMALRVAAEYQGEINLLVTDVVMPGGMSGRQLAEHLRNACPSLCILYMSGYTDDAILQHGILNSGAAFLEKPFTPTSLLNKVRQVLDR